MLANEEFMHRLEDYLVEKLKDPEFAAAFWEAEAEHPIFTMTELDHLQDNPTHRQRAPHLTFAEIMALPPAEHRTPAEYNRPMLRVIRTSAN